MPSKVVQIRSASPTDAPVIAELNVFVHEPHRAAMPLDYRPYDPNAAADYFATALRDNDHLIWLAEIGSRPVGFIEAEVITRAENPFTTPLGVMYVHQLAVAADFRRMGVARALMAAVEEAGRSLGVSEVRLEHRSFNEGAHSFYEVLGYRTYSVKMRKSVG